MLVPFSSCFSIMKMQATCFCETSVDFQWTTRYYIPEDRTLYSYWSRFLRGDTFLRNVGWFSTDYTVLFSEDRTLRN
jgi:hypothetical protein